MGQQHCCCLPCDISQAGEADWLTYSWSAINWLSEAATQAAFSMGVEQSAYYMSSLYHWDAGERGVCLLFPADVTACVYHIHS